MGVHLAAVIYGLLAQAGALVLSPTAIINSTAIRGLAVWAVALVSFCYLRDFLLILFAGGMAMLLLAPDNKRRVAFFLIVAPCLPTYVEDLIPLPGIQTLVTLTPYKIASLVLLLPVLLSPASPGDNRSWGIAELALILSAVYRATATGAAEGLTVGLRAFADLWMLMLIPYFAIMTATRGADRFEECAKALILTSIIFSMLVIVSVFKVWDFYRLYVPITRATTPIFREGFLRIDAVASSNSLAFHCGLGWLLLENYRERLGVGFLRMMSLRALFLATIYLSMSRGTWGGVFVMAIVYFVLTQTGTKLRILLLALSCGALAYAGYWLVSGEVEKLDPYGTFAYRQDLFRTSIAFIGNHFWFGNFHFVTTGEFAHLLQGQGIIDITNLFLQIALQYGVVGLLLFAGTVVPILYSLTRLAAFSRPGGDEERRRRAALLLGALLGWLAMVATTSDVGLVMQLGILVLAMGRACTSPLAKEARPLPGRPGAAARMQAAARG